MERTSIRLGSVEIASSIMNASGARSAERGEIFELGAVHSGALVFKSCNLAGLEAPENLKNRGVEHFAAIAGELGARGKKIIGSVVGASEEEFIAVARTLDRAGANIVELNLADDYVAKSLAPFSSFERLKSLLGRIRAETRCVLAVKVPPRIPFEPRSIADLFKSMRIAIAVCANDLPKDLEIDIATGVVKGRARVLSQTHAFFRVSENLLDVVAVGGINTGRDAYIAHLTGAKAVQVGSALMKEGAGALGRIDRELDSILAEHGRKSVSEIVGQLRFED
jgi:dihydroorotate dehydrogenase (fumarate)